MPARYEMLMFPVATLKKKRKRAEINCNDTSDLTQSILQIQCVINIKNLG